MILYGGYVYVPNEKKEETTKSMESEKIEQDKIEQLVKEDDGNNSIETATNLEPQHNLETASKNYCSVIKKVKKDNITCENIGEIMLCQIPGVSSVSAIAILGKFKTLPVLIKSIQEDTKCLDGITTCDANGKTRKISKTVLASIVKFLS
jgi:hypothetical protein